MTRIRQIAAFLTIFALILLLSHFYLFERIGYYLQLTDGQRLATGLLLGGLALLTLISLPLSRTLPRAAASALAWVVYPWMGFALLMFVTFIVTDIVWLSSELIPANHLHEPRLLLQHCFGIVALGATALLGGISLWNGLRPVSVKRLTVTLRRWPQALDGMRIAQLTDLHIGPLIDGDWLRRVVERTNALKPDLIVITGDLVDGSVEELGRHVAPIADLRAPHGVFFITGNHEYYSGAEQWCAHLTGLGIRVLRNQRAALAADSTGGGFDLAGVDDWASRSFAGEGPNLGKALAGRDANKALILLAHQPAAVDEAAAQGVDLQLSGHTHGGQLWPFTYLVQLQQPYTQGLHRHKDTETQIYVSPGTGFWGPPMRLGTVAEITLLTLKNRF